MCQKCKSAVKVELKDLPKNCDFGMDPNDQPSRRRRLLSYLKGRRKLLSMGLAKGFPGIGTMKSFEERCKATHKGVKGKLGSFNSKANKRVCECLGCCDPSDPAGQCFFPMEQII